MLNHKETNSAGLKLTESTETGDHSKGVSPSHASPVQNEHPQELTIALNKIRSGQRSDRKHILVERIKSVIVDMIYYSDAQIKVNYSDFLSQKLNCNYTYMSNLYSKLCGHTIQHFIITTKINHAKELMMYNDITLTEIAFKLHYSSVAHISNQFKKITGLSPSAFKASLHNRETLYKSLPAS